MEQAEGHRESQNSSGTFSGPYLSVGPQNSLRVFLQWVVVAFSGVGRSLSRARPESNSPASVNIGLCCDLVTVHCGTFSHKKKYQKAESQQSKCLIVLTITRVHHEQFGMDCSRFLSAETKMLFSYDYYVHRQIVFFPVFCGFFSPANTYLISERSLNDLLLNTIFCHSGSWLGRTVNQGKVEGTDGWWVGTWHFLCPDSEFHIPCTLAVTLCSQVYRCGPGSHNKQQRDGPDLEAKPVWLRLWAFSFL